MKTMKIICFVKIYMAKMNFVKMNMVKVPAFFTVFTSLTNLNVGLRDKDNLKFVLIFLDLVFLMTPKRGIYK